TGPRREAVIPAGVPAAARWAAWGAAAAEGAVPRVRQAAAGGGAEPVQAVQGWVQRERDQGGGVTRDEVELLRFGLRLVQEQADKYAEEGRQRHMQALEKVAALVGEVVQAVEA